jgi:ADP-heptose:LPS heptosyltransferase
VLAALGTEAIDLVGALALPEVAAVIARCALFVGNDSGLMHLSAATGTPTLGLFGPSRVSEYGPAGRRVAAAASPTSPDLHAMPGLAFETALAAAEQLLATDPAEAWRPILATKVAA